MENQEDDADYRTQKNSNFDPEATVHLLTPTNSSNRSLQYFTPIKNDESPTKMKISNESPLTKSENKKKIVLQSAASAPQKNYNELISPAKKAIILKSPIKSDIYSPSCRGPSQLRISGQKIVGESISLIRPMKCCNYDTPDIFSNSPINQQKPSYKSNVTATSVIIRRQQLQEQRLQKIRMMQQNVMVNYKSPNRQITREDMKQIKKGIEMLERKRKIAEEAKQNENNFGTQNPNFINLLPTGLI